MKTSLKLRLPGWIEQAWTNPVIVKETRTRMRGWRAFILVTAHLAALGLMIGLAYLTVGASIRLSSNLEQRRIFGKALFWMLVGLELVMISFTAPALTAGAIANEHERQTYDLLRVTLLRPAALVSGKYLSGLIFILLLLFTSLPLLSPAFLVGGVLPQEIIIALLTLLTTAIAFCAVGMFFSSLTQRTLFSTVLAYAFAILLVFGLPMVMLFTISLLGVSMGAGNQSFSTAAQIFLVYLGWALVSINPGAALIATEAALLDQQGIWSAHIDIKHGIEVWMVSPWLAYVVFYLLVSLLLLWISVQRVRRLER